MHSADPVGDAARFLAGRGIFGLAWLDHMLRTTSTFGALASHVPVGVVITESIPALMGLDDEIRELAAAPHRSIAIPNVRVEGQGEQAERVNFAIYRRVDEGGYLLLVARAVSRSDLEYSLAAEVRGRSIAEAEVASQARLLQRANRELAAANRDLQEFASVISHDLRAPLRGLRYAATDARGAVEHGDLPEAAAKIAAMLQQTRRMGAMLTGLLDYAQIGRKADAVETVETAPLAAEIVRSIGAGATQHIAVEGDWPTLVTLREPLDIVLRNLLDNAVKHHDRSDGTIVVRAEDRPTEVVVSVIDDGPGIAPEWHAAIFMPFKQVADSDSTDGSGIGLALVKKTVERFGGWIEVISDPATARGTTFRLAWPKTITL